MEFTNVFQKYNTVTQRGLVPSIVWESERHPDTLLWRSKYVNPFTKLTFVTDWDATKKATIQEVLRHYVGLIQVPVEVNPITYILERGYSIKSHSTSVSPSLFDFHIVIEQDGVSNQIYRSEATLRLSHYSQMYPALKKFALEFKQKLDLSARKERTRV